MGRSNAGILAGMFIIAIIIVVVILWVNPAGAEPFMPEIDQNQVEDEISRTFIVHLQDGIRSADGIN